MTTRKRIGSRVIEWDRHGKIKRNISFGARRRGLAVAREVRFKNSVKGFFAGLLGLVIFVFLLFNLQFFSGMLVMLAIVDSLITICGFAFGVYGLITNT